MTTPAERGGALEVLRFLAAAFIVLYHAGGDAPTPLAEMAPVLGRGWLATNFFLILSGFVLGRAYGPQLDAGRVGGVGFFTRRLTRVWPGQALVLAGFVGLLAAAGAAGVAPRHAEHFTAGDFLQQLLLAHAWGFDHGLGWNTPSWSLSVLVVCYALFAPAWGWARRISPGAALMAAPAVVLAAAVGVRLGLGESLYDLRADAGLWRGLPLFLCGLLLARAAAGLSLTVASARGLMAAALAALAISQAADRSEATAFAGVLALGVLVVAADAWTGRSRLAALGARLSWSLFISSSLTGAVWFGMVHLAEARLALAEPLRWALWAGFIPAAIAAAWAFDRWLDAPVQRWIKTWRERPRGTPVEAAG